MNPMTISLATDVTEPSLPFYEGIALSDVRVIASQSHAREALNALMASDVIGFDTESKPTFNKGEQSDGPHLIQLATDDIAYLFPIGRLFYSEVLTAVLESTTILKVGFGLGDDVKRLKTKCGIGSAHVLDLSVALRQDSRNDVGAKTAVARLFGSHLRKSKKTSTSNWAKFPLTERQILYAANDAHVALRIYRFWRKNA